MKKILIYILFSGVFCAAAQNIEQAFVNLPDQYIPLLSKERRMQLLFHYIALTSEDSEIDNGRPLLTSLLRTDSIENNFKGISKMQILDSENNYLKIALTEKSTFEMKIWELNDTTEIIGFSHTVCAPVCDSQVAFFNKNFRRLDTDANQMFPDIAIQDFLNREKIAADGEKLENMVIKHDALFATIVFQQQSDTILLKSNVKEFLTAEIYAGIEPYLTGNTIELTWENGIFKKGGATWK